jgi:hypothetical protein
MENKGNKTNYPIWEKLNGTHEKAYENSNISRNNKVLELEQQLEIEK